MQIRIIFVALIVATCISCNRTEDKFAKLWLFSNYTGTADRANNNIANTSFLLLAADDTYTKDFPVFQSGKWAYLRDTLFLSTDDGFTEKYKAASDGKELRIEVEKDGFASFRAFPVKAEAEDENPFSAKNNQWRVKARRKETDDQITARLLNHLRFWECYFTWAYNNKLASIDVRSTATPIKIYGNGFGIKPQAELPKAWTRLFYDEQDALRANELLEEVVRTHRINWPATENKYKMFVDAFRQLQENVRKR